MHWYKRDPNAALTGMAELSLEERGAYNSLLDILYSRDGDLPDDDQLVGRIMRCNPRTWRKIKMALIGRGKVWVSDGKLMAKRVEKELKEAAKLSEAQSNKAGKRWEEHRKNKENNDPPMPPGNASTSTSTSTTTAREEKKEAHASRGAALPEGWTPSDEDFSYGEKLGLTQPQVLECLEEMRLWAGANSNRSVGRKANWSLTFQSWMRRNRKRGTNGQTAKDRSKDDFRTALDQLREFGEGVRGHDGREVVQLLPAARRG